MCLASLIFFFFFFFIWRRKFDLIGVFCVFQATGMELNLSKNVISCGESGMTFFCAQFNMLIMFDFSKYPYIYSDPRWCGGG